MLSTVTSSREGNTFDNNKRDMNKDVYLKIHERQCSQDKVIFALTHKYTPFYDTNYNLAATENHSSIGKFPINYTLCHPRPICLFLWSRGTLGPVDLIHWYGAILYQAGEKKPVIL